MESYIDEKELKRIKRNEVISKQQEQLIVKKEQILAILRDLPLAEARYILNEVKRKWDNDEIDAKFIVKE